LLKCNNFSLRSRGIEDKNKEEVISCKSAKDALKDEREIKEGQDLQEQF